MTLHFIHFKPREFDPIELVPKIQGNVYQPFLGTEGIVHLIKHNKKTILSDYDKELVLLFRYLKNDYDKLEYYLNELFLTHSKAVYNETKQDFLMYSKAHDMGCEQSARYLYLLHYNNNFSMNKKFYHKRVLKKWHQMMHYNVEINHTLYFLISPKEQDFVYLEPIFYNKYFIGNELIKLKIDEQIRGLTKFFLLNSKRNVKILLVCQKHIIAKVKRACRFNDVYFESLSFAKTGWLKNYKNA